jgi:hypothetical protein
MYSNQDYMSKHTTGNGNFHGMNDFENLVQDVIRKEKALDNIGLTGVSASFQGKQIFYFNDLHLIEKPRDVQSLFTHYTRRGSYITHD